MIIIMEKKYPFVESNIQYWIMADFLMSETQQPIIDIIFIIYFSNFFKYLVEF